jgi:hypothetical protein
MSSPRETPSAAELKHTGFGQMADAARAVGAKALTDEPLRVIALLDALADAVDELLMDYHKEYARVEELCDELVRVRAPSAAPEVSDAQADAIYLTTEVGQAFTDWERENDAADEATWEPFVWATRNLIQQIVRAARGVRAGAGESTISPEQYEAMRTAAERFKAEIDAARGASHGLGQ